MRPVTLYATARGDFAPAHALTVEEALDAYEQRLLLVVDVPELSDAARQAVTERMRAGIESHRWGRRLGDHRHVITTTEIH